MKNRILITLLLGILLASCNISRSVVSRDVDLSKYEYASVVTDETNKIPAWLMEYEMPLFEAIEENSGLEMVSDQRIGDLSSEQKVKLLLVKYGFDITDERKLVVVSFQDYQTGRPVATCRATCHFAVYVDNEIMAAIEQVGKQIAKTFNRVPEEQPQ